MTINCQLLLLPPRTRQGQSRPSCFPHAPTLDAEIRMRKKNFFHFFKALASVPRWFCIFPRIFSDSRSNLIRAVENSPATIEQQQKRERKEKLYRVSPVHVPRPRAIVCHFDEHLSFDLILHVYDSHSVENLEQK